MNKIITIIENMLGMQAESSSSAQVFLNFEKLSITGNYMRILFHHKMESFSRKSTSFHSLRNF